ncbi:MAG: translation initiation factor eIF-1A [Methanocella sp.]
MNYRSAKRQGKKPGDTGSGEVVRVRTPRKMDREVLGTVTDMLGGSRVTVQCMDSVTRMCRIRGKMKKRTWVREGDTVIVVPWDIQDAKGDVVWRYTGPQVSWLGKKGFLNNNE